MPSGFEFNLTHTCGRARRGVISTPHGRIDTPAFMPVGTRATVKGITPAQLAETGTQICLANTYHLMLRPGADVVAELGGLHRLMAWNGAILTDSGGFQVFSLADLRRLDDDGVEFRSHIDGAAIRLTPEGSIQAQNQLGADIIMAFDECPPLPAEPAEIEAAVRRTIAWARRSKAAHARPDQALYGIVQGGLDVGSRRRCLEQLVEIGFDGYALGGLSVGEPPQQMWAFLDEFADELPADRPRYLMGVGTPRDLVEAGRGGNRPVRLRDADAQRPQVICLHVGGRLAAAERAASAVDRAARPGVRLLHLPGFLARLSAAFVHEWRGAWSDVDFAA